MSVVHTLAVLKSIYIRFFRFRAGVLLLLAVLPVVLFAVPVGAHAQATPADQLAVLATHLDAATAALTSGDVDTGQSEFQAFEDGWFDIEDGVKEQSRPSYLALEDSMRRVHIALASDPLDSDNALATMAALRFLCDSFIYGEAALSG